MALDPNAAVTTATRDAALSDTYDAVYYAVYYASTRGTIDEAYAVDFAVADAAHEVTRTATSFSVRDALGAPWL